MQFPRSRSAAIPASPVRWSLVPMAALLASCGGGGGGDDSDDFFQVLAYYDFAITNPSGAPAPLTRTVIRPPFPGDEYTIDAGTGSIRGRYFTNDSDFTIADTTTYTVTWSQGGPDPTQFSVGFTSPASFPSGNFMPVSGSFAVTWGTETITVDYGFTVELGLNGGPPVVLTPAEFNVLDIPPTSAPDWQRVAARASHALLDVLGRARGVVDFLERVNDGELDSGQSVTPCTMIPGSPPAGIGQSGEVVAVELGGGSQYRSTYTDCFVTSGAQPTRGVLATGTINRNNLVTTVDGGSEGGSLVEFGFVGSAQASGGVSFATRARGMTESAPGTWTFVDGETVDSGGFSIHFTYPD